MAQSYSHCWELYYKACGGLMGEGTRKERLRNAISEMFVAHSEEIPPKVKPHWQAIHRLVDASQSSPEGKIHSYVEQLDSSAVRALYDQIFDDFLVIDREYSARAMGG